jgi:hypothetical protein
MSKKQSALQLEIEKIVRRLPEILITDLGQVFYLQTRPHHDVGSIG